VDNNLNNGDLGETRIDLYSEVTAGIGGVLGQIWIAQTHTYNTSLQININYKATITQVIEYFDFQAVGYGDPQDTVVQKWAISDLNGVGQSFGSWAVTIPNSQQQIQMPIMNLTLNLVPTAQVNPCQQGKSNVIPPNVASVTMNVNWRSLYKSVGTKLAFQITITKYANLIALPGGAQTAVVFGAGTMATMLSQYGLDKLTNITSNLGTIIPIVTTESEPEIPGLTQPTYDWYFTIDDTNHNVTYNNFSLVQLTNL